MGTFTHTITLISASGETRETVEVLVDTGAMFSVIPTSTLEWLGIRPFRTMPVRFANGGVQQWSLGQMEVELDGQCAPILCFFGLSDAPPLIGAHMLEALLLTVDPVEEKLVPEEALLMRSG